MGFSTTTRVLTLRAPIASEEERAHFQKRLSTTLLSVFGLAGIFWVMSTALIALTAPDKLSRTVSTLPSQVHIATMVLALGTWLPLRKARSVRVLDLVDALGAIALCTGWALMVAADPVDVAAGRRPEFIALLACSYTLVVRAALIPSTPARTALVGVIAMVPTCVSAFVLYQRLDFHTPLPVPAYVVMWAVLGVAATAVISQTIYGLQLAVRRAMQLGQYVLEEKIGEGGMGAVYRAHHALLRRPTAIKLVSEATAEALERFEREVRITARLTHPNTIAIFDYGRTPGGIFYYAMELLDGVSLERLVEQHGPQPPSRVVHLLLQICGALEEAHAAGLVHRDIKPANIMLTRRGGIPDFVKVLDFGLVKERTDTQASVTSANIVLGTPHYMAPEAVLDAHAVDARTDLYAVGATAFLLLTGSPVFDGSNVVEVCSKHLHEPPAAPSTRRAGIPEALDAIVLACLEKKPGARPADAAELARRLRETGLAWTRDDAVRWWETHEVATPELAKTSQGAKTVAVALAGRS